MLANAYQERYMPGSTMKVVTTAIGFDTGLLTLDRKFKNERAWVPPNTTKPIRNYGKKLCGGDVAEVFRRSCNIPFAQLAVEIGPDQLTNGVARFGFEERVPFDLPGAAASTFGGLAKDFADSLALLAIHGFGQGQVQISPLHMANDFSKCRQWWTHDGASCCRSHSHSCRNRDFTNKSRGVEDRNGSHYCSNPYATHDWCCKDGNRRMLFAVARWNLRCCKDGNRSVESRR